MLFYETLHGLVLNSAIEGVGLPLGEAGANRFLHPVPVAIRVLEPLFPREATAAASEPALAISRSCDGASVCLAVRGVGQFIVTQHSVDVRPCHIQSNDTVYASDDLRLFLRYHALGLLLRLRGLLVLHGAAVLAGDSVDVWVGASGAGKTSTAIEACSSGALFVSDEVVTMRERDGQFWVLPGVPWARLQAGAPARLLSQASVLRAAPAQEFRVARVMLAGARGRPGEKASLGAHIMGGYRPELMPTTDEMLARQSLLDACGAPFPHDVPRALGRAAPAE